MQCTWPASFCQSPGSATCSLGEGDDLLLVMMGSSVVHDGWLTGIVVAHVSTGQIVTFQNSPGVPLMNYFNTLKSLKEFNWGRVAALSPDTFAYFGGSNHVRGRSWNGFLVFQVDRNVDTGVPWRVRGIKTMALADVPTRSSHGFVSLPGGTDTLIIFGGGMDCGRHFLNDLWEVKGALSEETTCREIEVRSAKRPSPRWGHSFTVCGAENQGAIHIILFGGKCFCDPTTGENLPWFNDTWRLTARRAVENDFVYEWREVVGLTVIPPPRHGHCSYGTSEYVIIHGGLCEDTVYGDVWMYRLQCESWSEVLLPQATLPRPPCMSGHGAFFVKGLNSLVLGGGNETIGGPAVTNYVMVPLPNASLAQLCLRWLVVAPFLDLVAVRERTPTHLWPHWRVARSFLFGPEEVGPPDSKQSVYDMLSKVN